MRRIFYYYYVIIQGPYRTKYSKCLQISVHLLGLLPDGSRDHLGVDLLDLWNSLAHQRGDLIICLLSVYWVADEQDTFDFWQLRQLGDLIPTLDPVVAHVESVELKAWVETLELLDLVVREPELLQGLTDLVETNNSLDVVSGKRQDLQVLQLWQVDDSLNLVGAQRELLTVLQLVEGIVHLVDEWNLAVESNLLGLGGDSVVLLLPVLDGVSARCGLTHILNYKL